MRVSKRGEFEERNGTALTPRTNKCTSDYTDETDSTEAIEKQRLEKSEWKGTQFRFPLNLLVAGTACADRLLACPLACVHRGGVVRCCGRAGGRRCARSTWISPSVFPSSTISPPRTSRPWSNLRICSFSLTMTRGAPSTADKPRSAAQR